jgi:phytoene dehydrogenase-like protein
MSDLAFDAVVCGGGNKALLLAMYLSKYGGMSVGIFERRHEIGGGLATEEIAASGFRGNTHANIILPWYYAPVYVTSLSSGTTALNGTSISALMERFSQITRPVFPSTA